MSVTSPATLAICAAFLVSLAAGSAEAQRTRGREVKRVERTEAHGRGARGGGRSMRNRARRRSLRTPERQAQELRARADRIARRARRAKTSSEAKRYLRKQYQKDVSRLLRSMETLQKGGELDAITEHRTMAAAARALNAGYEIDPASVPEGELDTLDTLYSRAAYRRRSKTHETSVEIETRMTEKILDAITTRDGTVRSILEEGGKEPPGFLREMARGGDVKDVQWDSLSREQKLSLLRSQSKGHRFFSDRRIPGVVFRRRISKPTGKKVELGGKTAGRLEKTASVDGVLMRKVEFMGPKAVDRVSGVEFHVRQTGRASRNADNAFTIVDLFKSPTTQGHEHIPNRLPRGVLKGKPVAREQLVDFYRRVNMVAELRSIKDGYLIKPVKDGNVIYFDFLKGHGLARLNEHLSAVSSGEGSKLRDSELKMGAVGFRRGELYGKKKMFGFEVRTLDKKNKERGLFVDAVQKGVLTGRYGLKGSTMRRWHAQFVGKQKQGEGRRTYVERESRALGELHYNRPIRQLLSEASGEIRPLLTDRTKKRLADEAEEHYGLKMLVHDFSRDPALSGTGKGNARAKVLEAQKEGLRALERGGDPDQIVRQFADASGLYEVYARSIGMRDPTLKNR